MVCSRCRNKDSIIRYLIKTPLLYFLFIYGRNRMHEYRSVWWLLKWMWAVGMAE